MRPRRHIWQWKPAERSAPWWWHVPAEPGSIVNRSNRVNCFLSDQMGRSLGLRPQMSYNRLCQKLTTRLIMRIEPGQTRAVQVQHPEQGAGDNQRHHQLRARRNIARDVAGKRMHVRHDDRPTLLCRGAADALAKRNTHTGRLALERPQNQFAVARKIKTSPI